MNKTTNTKENRSHPLKQNTFVLDFVNTSEDIEKAFKPYFESTILGEATDPNKLFDLYKLYSDNKEFKKDFSAMMFGVVKEILKTELSANP